MTAQAGDHLHLAPVRVARIIGRLNVGGPAAQALVLTRRLEAHGFTTELIRGNEGPMEGSMDELAQQLGVTPLRVPEMRREVGWRDPLALAKLVLALRRIQPAIVHTEAAKAGTLGRSAALLLGRPRRPVIVHTFHGHSLEGYFSARRASVFLAVERFLARRTDLLIAVSDEVADDLARLGVAPRAAICVVPVGLDLARFDLDPAERAQRRQALHDVWGIAPNRSVVTLVARLVPIKRVDRFLRIAARLSSHRPDLEFVIVGDGELRTELQDSPAAVKLGRQLTWTGWQRDMPAVCAASDVMVLTSDNEGTPVSLIEAQAARLPVVGTDVGGMGSVVVSGRTGYLVAADDEASFADAVQVALRSGDALGLAGREHVLARFSEAALLETLAERYRELLRNGSR